MPEPEPKETREDFVARCMADPEAKKTFGDPKQRQAFCESQYDDKDKKEQSARLDRPPLAALRVGALAARPGKVDRGKGVVYGYTVAQTGPFKSGRGAFNAMSLQAIAKMMNEEEGKVKSHFGHATPFSDSLGKFLGWPRNARVEGDKVKADLHLDPTSHKTPFGDLGGYVLALAESNAAAFASSLVLAPRQEDQLDARGKQLLGKDNEPLPPLWFPLKIMASDVVADGDAVHDGFLSVPERFLAAVLAEQDMPGKPALGMKMDCPDCGAPLSCPECGWESADTEEMGAEKPLLAARRERMRELERMAGGPARKRAVPAPKPLDPKEAARAIILAAAKLIGGT